MKHEPIDTILYAQMVDELAALKAQVAPLEARMELIKDNLKMGGRERYDGTEHTAVVSLSERETIDSKQLKFDHPKLVEPYLRRSLVTVVKLTGRKTR